MIETNIIDISLLSLEKLIILKKYILNIENLDGNTAEIGVYLGGTSKLIHTLTPNKNHYCYDTFEGIIDSNNNYDKHKDGEFNCSLEEVKKNINMENIIYKKGNFKESFTENKEYFCFVHCDCATYLATKYCLKYMSSRIVSGGHIIIDDYKIGSCPGVEIAINEFIKDDNLFIHTPLIHTNQYILTRKLIDKRSLYLSDIKAETIYNSLSKVINLDGNTAEVGVYLGGTSKLIHTLTSNKVHYCYDTFCGILGADSNYDNHKDGDFSCSLNEVKKNINMENIIYKVGYFPDTFEEYNEKFCFVHSDTDTYIGTKSTLDYFCKRMVQYGKIVFDDYTIGSCPGVEIALHEFLKNDSDFFHEPLPELTQYIITKK
jgi:O-methyltransferase